MKRIISLCLVSAFVCAGVVPPAAAQRAREVKPAKVKAVESGTRFSSVQAYSEGNGVMVSWQMASEVNNIGFSVFRLDGQTQTMVSHEMVMSSATSRGGSAERYSYFDVAGTSGSIYFVQYIGGDGKAAVSDFVSVQPVADLASAAGLSGGDLQRQVQATKRNWDVAAERLALPKDLAQEVDSYRLSADAATHAWVVSQPGVKIGVRRDGFYRVTKSELQAAGFNVNGDPSFWQLYREGVQQAIAIGPNADYIEFYGKAVDTPETDQATYFLVSGPTSGKRIATRSARPLGSSVTSQNYQQSTFYKQKVNYVNQVLNGEDDNFWGAAVATSGLTNYTFALTGVDFTTPTATVEVKLQGLSFHPHNIQVSLNGESLPPISGNARNPFSMQYSIPTSYLREGNNTLSMKETGSNFETSLFDSVKVSYARKYLAVQNIVRFYTSNYRRSKLEGFSSPNVRVFDMTNEADPVEWGGLNVIPQGSTYSVLMPADRGRSMMAMEAGAVLGAPVTPNDPATLRSSAQGANLVIISHKNWMTEAENWANYRRGQGFSVRVVDVTEIYDEFNYGDLSALSIRAFLQYAKSNWQTPPSYALLLGDASYDSRNYQGFGFHNYVPTHIVNTIFSEVGSDDSLADFNGDGLAEIAVGRIPGRNGQAITNALGKVTALEQGGTSLQSRGALFVSDAYDALNNYDFEAISTNLKNQLPAAVPVAMIGRGNVFSPPDTPQTALISAINAGKYVVNYSGHGTAGAWANPSFFSNNNVPQLTNAANQSIFTMLTCHNGYFLHATSVSLGENLLAAVNGGAVAVWASTGETTPDVQEVMATRFFQKLGQGQITRLGDLVNDAKMVIPGGTDVRLSWALLGDPMLKVQN